MRVNPVLMNPAHAGNTKAIRFLFNWRFNMKKMLNAMKTSVYAVLCAIGSATIYMVCLPHRMVIAHFRAKKIMAEADRIISKERKRAGSKHNVMDWNEWCKYKQSLAAQHHQREVERRMRKASQMNNWLSSHLPKSTH